VDLGLASWLCVLTPIFASGVIFTLGATGLARRKLVEAIAVAAAGLGAAMAAYLSASAMRLEEPATSSVSLVSPIFGVAELFNFQLFIDGLSATMALFVAVVSFAIVVYSLGYMAEDESYIRYYGLVMLFIGSMLGLVLAGHLVLLYLFWESVGLCSCLLIAHWYEKPEAAAAGVKAFVVTRFGDFALLTAIALLYLEIGHLDYFSVAEGMSGLPLSILNVVLLLALGGAVGKSAQVPLHVWLPDAMEGPTSVSALIHAATMVKAGVYLVARMESLAVGYGGVSVASISQFLSAVLLIGSVTAFLAATMALVAFDLKRVLAYSTISQLGYMFAGLGLALYVGVGHALWSALYHLTSHAVFKALLFMAAGAVIHSVGTRDMREMGGLSSKMPITFAGFLLGSLALAGVPPLNGFFSKDAIVGLAIEALHENLLPGLLLVSSAALTAFYILRALYLTFLAPPKPSAEHAHEAPTTMSVPIMTLAALTLASPVLFGVVFPEGGLKAAFHIDLVHAGISLAVVGLGASLAIAAYWLRYPALVAASDSAPLRAIRRVLEQGYYFDQLYVEVLVPLFRGLIQEVLAGLDMGIDALVNLAGLGAMRTANLLKRAHTGKLTHFFAASILGLLLLLVASILGG